MTDPKRVVVPLLAGPGNPHKGLGAKSKTAPRSRVGEQSRRACRGLRMKETLPVAGGRAGSTRPRPGSPRLRMDRPPPSQPADICQAPTKCLGGLRCQGHSWTRYVPLQFHWR